MKSRETATISDNILPDQHWELLAWVILDFKLQNGKISTYD